ncbi:hypothetical protein [Shouchella lonarensis]|uniref:Uncharacterized protein n=1 Tax=Shouchella lonarensis TaxID=1464122 RepID=A0A1G6HUX1_9BACI|nr:hypothetical protein [Shouchella lonarensis]SDB97938.1 hypothetical protein SAMN05421737_104188 [Shouchella lonarensis]
MDTAVSDYIYNFIDEVTQATTSLPSHYTEQKRIALTKEMQAFARQSLENRTPEATITLLQYQFPKPNNIAAEWQSQYQEHQVLTQANWPNFYVYLIISGFGSLLFTLITGTFDISVSFIWILGALIGVVLLNTTKKPLDVASLRLLKRIFIPASFGAATISLLLNHFIYQNIQSGLIFFSFYIIISLALHINFHYLLKKHSRHESSSQKQRLEITR